MTTLVAVQQDGFCIIAADSQATVNYRKLDTSPVGKIHLNNGYLIAAAGSGRGANILAFDWTPPVPRGDLDRFITRRVIPSMRKKFIESGHEIKGDGVPSSFDNELLIAVNGQIYQIFEDYGWERCATGLYASGSGGEFALGALHALDVMNCETADDVIRCVDEAMAVATKLDIFSGGRIQVAFQLDDGETKIKNYDEVDQ